MSQITRKIGDLYLYVWSINQMTMISQVLVSCNIVITLWLALIMEKGGGEKKW